MRKMKKIRNSFKYAIEGIWTSFKTERNMKIHIFIMILVIIAGIILKINKSEWIICIILFAIVIGSELFNTSIETIWAKILLVYCFDKLFTFILYYCTIKSS